MSVKLELAPQTLFALFKALTFFFDDGLDAAAGLPTLYLAAGSHLDESHMRSYHLVYITTAALSAFVIFSLDCTLAFTQSRCCKGIARSTTMSFSSTLETRATANE